MSQIIRKIPHDQTVTLLFKLNLIICGARARLHPTLYVAKNRSISLEVIARG